MEGKGSNIGGKIASAAFWAAVGAASVILTDKKQRDKVAKEVTKRKDEAAGLVKNVTDKAKDFTKKAQDKLENRKEELEEEISTKTKTNGRKTKLP